MYISEIHVMEECFGGLADWWLVVVL